MSKETAYQMTSILEGTVKRGTAKDLRELNLDLGEKLEPLIKILIHGLLIFFQLCNRCICWL